MLKYRFVYGIFGLILMAAPWARAQNVEIDTSSPFLYPE